MHSHICLISPVHTSDSNAIRPWFESASVVASSFTLQGSRGGLTAVRFCGGLLFTCSKNPPSPTEDARDGRSRHNSPTISNAVSTPKSQSSRKRWHHNHKSLSNHGQIAFESHCVNGAIQEPWFFKGQVRGINNMNSRLIYHNGGYRPKAAIFMNGVGGSMVPGFPTKDLEQIKCGETKSRWIWWYVQHSSHQVLWRCHHLWTLRN